MPDGRFDLEEAVAVLERTPGALDALLRGLPERWVRADEGEGTWSPYDVVGHLSHAERDNWIPRARHILDGAGGPFRPFDRAGHFARAGGRPLEALLEEFAALRRESLAALREMRLGDPDLARTGVHPEFGTVTLAQLLATWVAHDLGHLAQVVRAMAGVHAEAVGPWRAYLSILRERG